MSFLIIKRFNDTEKMDTVTHTTARKTVRKKRQIIKTTKKGKPDLHLVL